MALAKYLTYAEPEAGYWATQSHDVDAIVQSNGGANLGSDMLSIAWQRSAPSNLGEDRAYSHFWFSKVATPGIFSFVPVGEHATIEGFANTWLTAIAAKMSTAWSCVEYVWHRYEQGTARTEDGRAQKPGPAVRRVTKAVTGADAGVRMPDQVASTITLRTASRRHWGRTYIGGITATQMDTTTGRFAQSYVNALADATLTFHDAAKAAGYQMGVYSQLHPAFLTPAQIVCDDTPDIQRRRRAKRTQYRRIL